MKTLYQQRYKEYRRPWSAAPAALRTSADPWQQVRKAFFAPVVVRGPEGEKKTPHLIAYLTHLSDGAARGDTNGAREVVRLMKKVDIDAIKKQESASAYRAIFRRKEDEHRRGIEFIKCVRTFVWVELVQDYVSAYQDHLGPDRTIEKLKIDYFLPRVLELFDEAI